MPAGCGIETQVPTTDPKLIIFRQQFKVVVEE